MAFDRFNDKPARREKRDGDRFGGKGGRFEEFGRGRGEGRAAFVQNATVRLDSDVARYFKSSEDVNAALRMVIALTKTVKAEEAPAKVEDDQPQAIEAAAETDAGEE